MELGRIVLDVGASNVVYFMSSVLCSLAQAVLPDILLLKNIYLALCKNAATHQGKE